MTHCTARPRRRTFVIAAALATAAGLGLGSARVLAQTGDQTLDFILAERFAALADDAVLNPNTPEPILREAAAMLDLARLYKPREVRFARSSADVLLRLGERDRALAALSALRALDPRDELAMIQFVDLSADKLETGEARATYLKQVADSVGISSAVRSHAASSLMNLCFERSQDAQALEALSQAISLNPQNLAALRARYQLAAQSGSATERAKAIAGIVQASPADPTNLISLAQECAAAGDYENAAFYYQYGIGIVTSTGAQPPMDDFIDLIAVSMLANQSAAAEQIVGNATQRLPNEARLFALQLMLAMANGKTDVELASQIVAARGVYLAQLASVSQALNQPENRTPPTTAPAVPLPNVTADAARLTQPNGDPNNLRGAYAVALAEQIWFDAYFRATPVEPAELEALRTLVGDPNDPLVVRLEGWSLLAAGRADEAVVKLTAVADRDGYAKLGLAQAASLKHDDEKAKQILNELLANRPNGLYGATVALAAKKAGLAAPEMTPTERQIAGLAGSIKNGVANLLNNARASYLLSARPLTISYAYGEPMLVELRILNTGPQAITIGPGGLIAPKFSVDVATRGPAAKVFPGTVIGQWTGPVRLPPQQQLVQVVRIDRGPFAAYLAQYPTQIFSINGSVTIDPMIVERGSFPTPGGQQATIGESFERKPTPLYVEAFRTQFLQRLTSGSPLERLTGAELAASVLPPLNQQKDNPAALKMATDLDAALQGRLSSESQPDVKSLATLAYRLSSAPADGSGVAQALTADPVLGSVPGQAMALWTARALPADGRKAVAQAVLAKRPQGPIQELATALSAQADLPAPPAPTSQPAGQPAGATQP